MKQSNCAGRTVRDIVEHNPEQVSEVWCRNIFRQLLQTLERQTMLQLPHRVISPDTVIVHDDGTAALLPASSGDPRPELADDLMALARTVHYAITHEAVPAGPLRGRALQGYSESLITAIDRSLAFDPARRPRSIGELRDLLGIVVFKPVPLDRKPRQAPQPRPPGRFHKTWTGAGIATLLVMGLAVFLGLRGPLSPSSPERIVALPPADRVVSDDAAGAQRDAPRPPAVEQAWPGPDPAAARGAGMAPDDDVRVDAGTGQGRPHEEASGADVASRGAQSSAGKLSAGRPKTPAGSPRSSAAAAQASPPALPRDTAAGPLPPAAAPGVMQGSGTAARTSADAVVGLRIRPWGVVYVDGIRRGISPPVKQLVLAPGRHAIRISNPGARERVLEVDTASGSDHIAVDFDSGPQSGGPP
jgi:hypothetical protein